MKRIKNILNFGEKLERHELKQIRGGAQWELCNSTGGASYAGCTLEVFECMGFIEGYGDGSYRKSVWNCPGQPESTTISDAVIIT